MAKRILSITSITPTPTADTVNLVDATYVALVQGAAALQRININEVWESGLAGSSAPVLMILSRDSTLGTTVSKGTGLTDAPIDASTAAFSTPPIVGNTCGGTKPQRDAANHLWNLVFNAFGGELRYRAVQGEEPTVIGTAVTTGEVSLSAFTGGSGTPLLGSHLIYEAL